MTSADDDICTCSLYTLAMLGTTDLPADLPELATSYQVVKPPAGLLTDPACPVHRDRITSVTA